MKKLIPIIVLVTALAAAGCSVIFGKDDTVTRQGISFRFVETLRNEASLRGESLKDRAFKTDGAITLQQPNSVFADAFRVYVTDASPARVFVFDRGESKTTILGNTQPSAQDEVKLIAPGGVTVDAAQTVWVSDSAQGRVFGYSRSGQLLFTIGRTAELTFPVGLASDRIRNRLAVADSHARQVKVFNIDGTRLFEIGTGGKSEEELRSPEAVAFDRSGNLYVLDTLRRRVQVYDANAKFLKGYSLSGTMPGHAVKPKGLAVDSDGHVYVTDSASNNILLFDREGIFLFTWGRAGSLNGDFWTPAGIFIDERDTIYIADQSNGRVQTFQYVK